MVRTGTGVTVPHVAARAIVLVEGESDRMAVEAAAALLRIDLPALDVVVLAMGGVTNIGHFLRGTGPAGDGRRIVGLCDSAEAGIVARALQVESNALQANGFQVCERDLEDVLRCLRIACRRR